MYKYCKRCIDLLVSVLGFIVLSPVFLILAILIKVTSRGDILFRQERVGENDSRFTIYKFRTMRSDTPKDVPTHLLENPDTFITSIGRILRKTSLDELPQIFNIIRGNMSIVGPRPSLPNQFDLNQLRKENGSIHLKPGLTGYAQIKGRDELPIAIKANFDKEYCERMSFRFDVYIFFATFLSVLRSEGVKEGVSQDGNN